MLADVREVVASRELLHNLTLRELRGKYKGTALGWAWSLVNPLASTAIFTAVFAVVLRVPPPVGKDGLTNYALFLLCGLLTWNFMSGAMSAGMNALVVNGNLVKKTYFPRRLLVVSTVAAGFVSYLIEMAVLVAVFLLFGVNVLVWVPFVLLVMVVVGVFGLGLALLLSVVNVYFRDVAHFVSIFLQIWFYATPIIYPISLVDQTRNSGSWAETIRLADLYQLNPMVAYVESVRDLLYVGTLPSAGQVLYGLGAAAVVLVIGNVVFGRMQARLAEEL